MRDAAFLQALVGEWIADDPGQATGGFTFLPDLHDTVYVRRIHASYPATAQSPAFVHDDLLVVYRDPQTQGIRAWYTDNEGHVITYAVRADEQTIEFLSDASPDAPRFRLRYTPSGADTLRIAFAIAPPGQPEAFSPYIESAVRRVKR